MHVIYNMLTYGFNEQIADAEKNNYIFKYSYGYFQKVLNLAWEKLFQEISRNIFGIILCKYYMSNDLTQ